MTNNNRSCPGDSPYSGNKDDSFLTVAPRLRRTIYDELRRLAAMHMRNERSDHTLRPTALVHEAYMRLVDQDSLDFRDSKNFLGIASHVMRQVLVDYARSKSAKKRGGKWGRIPLEDTQGNSLEFEILAFDDALNELAELDDQASRVVEMRVLSGMKMQDIADVIKVSKRTVEADWQMAKMWLSRRLS